MEEFNIISGILDLGVPGILAVICWKLWGAYQEQLAYNRESDKSNLEAINKVINFVDKLTEAQKGGDSTTHTLLKEIKADLIEQLKVTKDAILSHIELTKGGD